MNNENLISNDLQVDTEIQGHLLQTAKWAKFLAIIGFIFTGLLLICIFFFMMTPNSNSDNYYYSNRNQMMSSGFSIFVFLIITAIVFTTSYFTFRFATKMKTAIQNTDQGNFNDALGNLSFNYKFLGIITIIYLGLMVLAVIASIFLASFSRA